MMAACMGQPTECGAACYCSGTEAAVADKSALPATVVPAVLAVRAAHLALGRIPEEESSCRAIPNDVHSCRVVAGPVDMPTCPHAIF